MNLFRTLCVVWSVLFLTPTIADEAQLKKSSSLYKQFCSHCHGLNMVNPGTSSYDLRKFPVDGKDRFYDSVKNGRGDMPAWGDILTEDELALLWYYVSSNGGKTPPAKDEDHTSRLDRQPMGSRLDMDELKVCLARNGGVMSAWRGSGGKGLDYSLSAHIAESLSLPLKVFWYEAEHEKETSPIKDAAALLAHGLCDVIPGVALYETSLKPLEGQRAALPRWRHRPSYLDKAFQVDLRNLAFSSPYVRAQIGIVIKGQEQLQNVNNLKGLDGLVLGIEQGTLTGAISQHHSTARMIDMAVTTKPGPAFLWEMENNRFQAALVSVAAYDFHKRQNRITELRLLDYRHPVGFNLAFVSLQERSELTGAINAVIAKALQSGVMERLAHEGDMTFASPQRPWVQPVLTSRSLKRPEFN